MEEIKYILHEFKLINDVAVNYCSTDFKTKEKIVVGNTRNDKEQICQSHLDCFVVTFREVHVGLRRKLLGPRGIHTYAEATA